jgi:hypothetical protein
MKLIKEVVDKEIIGWYEYTTIVYGVGINGEQRSTVTNYEPIFEGETEEDARLRVEKEVDWGG